MTTPLIDLSARPFDLDEDGRAWVETTLAGLTLEQRIGQLLCVYLRTDDVEEWLAGLRAHGIEPGGVLLIPRSRATATADVAELQRRSRVPLLVAANLEAGAGNFLTDVEAFAHPMQIAATGEARDVVTLAEHCADIAGEVGINWAFAPVVDIAVNPGNPITNTRTFGSDPVTVAGLGAAYVRELERRSIATSPKHFPGDGVDDRDQHLLTTNNDLPAQQWRATFGEVYREVVEAGARTIMAGHIRQPALSRELRPGTQPGDLLPASLAPELLIDLLRGELGFNGMIVSDNTAMAGFTTAMPRAAALPASVAAGVDMILGNLSVQHDFRILLDAVRDGVLDIDRVDDAVRRVLATKASIGLHRAPATRPAVRSAELDLADRDDIARRSVTLVKDTQGLLPLCPTRHRRALVVVVGDEPTFYDPSGPFAPLFLDGLRQRGLEVTVRYVAAGDWDPDVDLAAAFDVCLYFANVRFVGNSNVLRVTWSPWQGPEAPRHVADLPTALVSVADPYLLQDVPMIRTAINCYTPTPSTVEVALQILFGEVVARGTSPVDPFAGRWDAAL